MIVRIVMHPIHMHLLHFSSGLDHCGVGGLIAAQALFDEFPPIQRMLRGSGLRERANTWWALQWSKVVPFVARCRLIDGSMFHVQALIALFSGTEAPWVANEWTRGVRLGGLRRGRGERGLFVWH